MSVVGDVIAILQLIQLMQNQIVIVEGNSERCKLLYKRCELFIEPLKTLENKQNTDSTIEAKENDHLMKMLNNLKETIFKCAYFIRQYGGTGWKKTFNRYFNANMVQEAFESLSNELSAVANDLNLGITIKTHDYIKENQDAWHNDSVKIFEFLQQLQEINNIQHVENQLRQSQIIENQKKQNDQLQHLIKLIVKNMSSHHADILVNSNQLFTLAQDFNDEFNSSANEDRPSQSSAHFFPESTKTSMAQFLIENKISSKHNTMLGTTGSTKNGISGHKESFSLIMPSSKTSSNHNGKDDSHHHLAINTASTPSAKMSPREHMNPFARTRAMSHYSPTSTVVISPNNNNAPAALTRDGSGDLISSNSSTQVTVKSYLELDYHLLLQKSLIHNGLLDYDEKTSTVIGSGSYGTVYKCTYHHRSVAVKKFKNFESFCHIAHEMQNLRREALIMQACKHLNILQYIGVDLDYGLLVTELAYCNLHTAIHSMTGTGDRSRAHSFLASVPEHRHRRSVSTTATGTSTTATNVIDTSRHGTGAITSLPQLVIDTKMKITWCFHILCGLRFLHFHEVIHRDLNLANVLLVYEAGSNSFIAKIADFGVSQAVGLTSTRGGTWKENSTEQGGAAGGGAVGTTAYMAPELFDDELPVNQIYTAAIDIYSFGITINEMFTGMSSTLALAL